MDSNSVVAIIALLCFFFFFFFFFLLGGVGVYFFIVKKKDTSEEVFSDMSHLRIPIYPLYPLVPLSPFEKSVSFDISKDKNIDERLKSVEKFLGSSYENRNDVDFVEKYKRSGNLDDKDNSSRVNLIQQIIFELQDTVSGLKQEKELREKNALEERIAQEEKERIETEAKRLLDNLEKAETYPVNSMEKKRISLPGPIEDAVLQKLYELDNSINFKSVSESFGDNLKILHFLEKSSFPNKENTKDTEITDEMKYQYKVNERLHGYH